MSVHLMLYEILIDRSNGLVLETIVEELQSHVHRDGLEDLRLQILSATAYSLGI